MTITEFFVTPTRNQCNTEWTDERVKKLKAHYDAGVSFGNIEILMPEFTRNALIGKVHRVGWPRRKGKSQQRVRRESKARAKNTLKAPFKPRIRSPQVIKEPPPPPATFDHVVQIEKLENHHCRYPLWQADTPAIERWYCGAPGADIAEGKAWCPWHAYICRGM